jgi:hypothetical protein
MIGTDDILISMRKIFSFLWDEYDFKFVGLMPKSRYHDHGYSAELENDWCKLVFQFKSDDLEDIYVAPKGFSSFGGLLSHWAMLSARDIRRRPQSPTAESVLNSFAEFAHPYLLEMLELAKTPRLFEERLKELEEASTLITIEMIRVERARLHSFGLDSSLGAAMKNLHKRVSHE